MLSKSKPTRNNPKPVEIKKEPEHYQQSEDKIIIIEQTIGSKYNYQIPFKREPIMSIDNYLTSNTFDYSVLNERIKQLESENKSLLNENYSLKTEMNGINETIQVKSNEIIDLQLKLKKFETNKINQIESNLDGNNIEEDDDETDFDQRIEASSNVKISYDSIKQKISIGEYKKRKPMITNGQIEQNGQNEWNEPNMNDIDANKSYEYEQLGEINDEILDEEKSKHSTSKIFFFGHRPFGFLLDDASFMKNFLPSLFGNLMGDVMKCVVLRKNRIYYKEDLIIKFQNLVLKSEIQKLLDQIEKTSDDYFKGIKINMKVFLI